MCLRVLHVIYSMDRAGAETMIMNYYRHINRNDVQFDFLVCKQDKCDYEDEIISLGGSLYRVPSLSKNPLGYILNVYSFLKSHQYKVVHSHNSAKNAVPLYLAKINHVPIRISHSHNIRNEGGMAGLVKRMLRPIVKYVATDYFACAKEAGYWLYGKKLFDGRGIVMKNAIEANKYSFDEEIRNRIRNNENRIIIGNVARFDEQKNHSFLIDIFSEIHKKNSNTVLFLIGDGPLKESIIAKVHHLGLENAVVFKGVVNNVNDYLQAMDIFLLPSLYEGLPVTLIEAQASGLRCFTSKDVVTDESNVVGLVTYIPLSDSPSIWANIILNSINYQRKETYKAIVSAGYDIVFQSSWLQKFYLERYESVK